MAILRVNRRCVLGNRRKCRRSDPTTETVTWWPTGNEDDIHSRMMVPGGDPEPWLSTGAEHHSTRHHRRDLLNLG